MGAEINPIFDKSVQINMLFIRLDIFFPTRWLHLMVMVLCLSYRCVKIFSVAVKEHNHFHSSARNNHWIVFHVWHFLISTLYFISRQQITNPRYVISYPEVQHTHGLISTSIGLDMRINSEYFEDGILRIKCVASISPTIWSGNKETVIQQQGLQQSPDIPAPSIDTREALFLGKKNFRCLSQNTF